jgi:hypothetical protein
MTTDDLSTKPRVKRESTAAWVLAVCLLEQQSSRPQGPPQGSLMDGATFMGTP